MNPNSVEIKQVRWRDEQQTLKQIRTEVFVKEQNVPEELEWDDDDQTCVHVLAMYNKQAIGTARLLTSGQIGRMAVLADHRHNGVGTALLQRLLVIAGENKLTAVFMNAQVDAIDFYRKSGFIEQGEVFNEASIPHKRMVKSTQP